MRNLINEILRLLIKIALHGYFNKIIVLGKENIPRNKSIILVGNHQNALLDSLLLATHTRLNPYFLARASAFSNPIADKLLRYIRMLPVFRIRDGFGSIPQNQVTFEQTIEVLKPKGTVIIFAEGNHSIVRNVRMLSKGFTRIAFGFKEKYPTSDLVILPVGFDYSCHLRSGGRVLLTFGKPIPVDMPSPEPLQLTRFVENSLKELVVNLPDEDYEETVKKLLENQVDLTSKQDIATFLTLGIVNNPVKPISSLRNKLMKIFHFPLYWLWLLKKLSVKDPVFSSTWKFLIGWIGCMLWYPGLIWLAVNSAVGTWATSFLLLGLITLWFNKNPQE
jgi:1-acyl-sn-glycerol-3-phosphate acyltransferase